MTQADEREKPAVATEEAQDAVSPAVADSVSSISTDSTESDPGESELKYVVLSPVEVVIQNLSEALLLDMNLEHLHDGDSEGWANVGWYMVSSSFPIVAASIGPLGNLCSAASVADTWRADLSDLNVHPADFTYILVLNGISLFLGCVSNIALFLNLSGMFNHGVLQTISIAGWYAASLILIGIITAAEFVYFRNGIYSHYEGFWFGVIAAIMYGIGATLLLVNETGRHNHRSSVPYSVTLNQRRLMAVALIFATWVGMGGGIFTAMIHGITYGDAVYFSMGVCLTVAAGDILPKSHLSRCITILYSYVGVFLVGLCVASIVAAVKEANGVALVAHRIERHREVKYAELTKNNGFDKMSPEDSFNIIRKINITERRKAAHQILITSLLLYAVFWLTGAMVFCLIEGWSYFEAIYFTGLIFVANSFGDFVPKTSGGRAFFVIWVFGAVPLMTILISGLSSTIFKAITHRTDRLTAWLLNKTFEFSEYLRGHKAAEPLQIPEADEAYEEPAPGHPLYLSSRNKDSESIVNSLLHDWPSSIDSDYEEDDPPSESEPEPERENTPQNDTTFSGDSDPDPALSMPPDAVKAGLTPEMLNTELSKEVKDAEDHLAELSKPGSETRKDAVPTPQSADKTVQDDAYDGDDDDDDDENDNIAAGGPTAEDEAADDSGEGVVFTDDAVLNPKATSRRGSGSRSVYPSYTRSYNPTIASGTTLASNYRAISDIRTRRMLILSKHVRTLSRALTEDPEMVFGYNEWSRILKVIHIQTGIDTPMFWLSPLSPLRLPIVEPCFFLLTSLTALEEEIAQIVYLQRGTKRPHNRHQQVGIFTL